MTRQRHPSPDVMASATTLRERLGTRAPRIAVLLGSGWGPFAEQVQDAVDVPYADLPAFPLLGQGVSGHVGLLRAEVDQLRSTT